MTDSAHQEPKARMIEIPGPDEPHRRWRSTDPSIARIELTLLIMAGKATSAVAKLLLGSDDLTKDEIITLGQLNYFCWLQGYEPAIRLVDQMPVDWNLPADQILDDDFVSRILRDAGMERS